MGIADDLMKDIIRLERHLSTARLALRYYAAERLYKPIPGYTQHSAIVFDEGETARKALAEITQAEPEECAA